uniref:Protein EXECUTER 1ic n=1 Tax=Rhizophora mucronata TaxID=61149 RepID=A0A2P2JNL6_RHIMU
MYRPCAPIYSPFRGSGDADISIRLKVVDPDNG